MVWYHTYLYATICYHIHGRYGNSILLHTVLLRKIRSYVGCEHLRTRVESRCCFGEKIKKSKANHTAKSFESNRWRGVKPPFIVKKKKKKKHTNHASSQPCHRCRALCLVYPGIRPNCLFLQGANRAKPNVG